MPSMLLLVALLVSSLAAQGGAPGRRLNQAARMPKPTRPVRPHTRVAVYHVLGNLDDMQGSFRWLYATVVTENTPTNLFYNVGRTLVLRSHDDVNVAFNTTCPCTLAQGSQCRVRDSSECICWKIYTMVNSSFHTMACPFVSGVAIARAQAAEYDSIQIMHHDLDVTGATQGQSNAKYEIIDLTSTSNRSNWVTGEQLGWHYFNEHGQPCAVRTRAANRGLEELYFGEHSRLLSCTSSRIAAPSSGSIASITPAVPVTCTKLTHRIHLTQLQAESPSCRAGAASLNQAVCNPLDLSLYAKNTCAVHMPLHDVMKSCRAFDDNRHYGSCAIVSSSGAMLGSGCGADIDSHDMVWRVNVPVLSGFESDVGARSDFDVIISWPARVIAGPSSPHYRKVKAVRKELNGRQAVPHSNPLRPMDLHNATALLSGGSLSLCRWFLRADPKPWKAAGLRYANPAFSNVWTWLSKFIQPLKPGWVPSTGLRTVMMAMSMCDEVSLYGFVTNADALPGGRYHYWDSGPEDPHSLPTKVQRRTVTHDDQMSLTSEEHSLLEGFARLAHVHVCRSYT